MKDEEVEMKHRILKRMLVLIIGGAWVLLLSPRVVPTPANAQTANPSVITVTGEVARPTEGLLLRPNMTLRDVISLVGGTTFIANRKSVSVKRGTQEIIVDVDKAYTNDPKNNIVVQPGDIIHVDALPPSALIRVEGGVTAPGSYACEKRMTVMRVILQAGGPAPYAKAKEGRILRTALDRPKQVKIIPFNFLNIIKGEQKDVEVVPGDTIVIPPGRTQQFRHVPSWVDRAYPPFSRQPYRYIPTGTLPLLSEP